MGTQATSVPAEQPQLTPLQVKLAKRAAEAKAKAQTQQQSNTRVIGVLDEDKDDLCIIIPKVALLEAVGGGNSTYKNQEGVHISVDGEFTYRIAEKLYTFHMRLFPAWARVDMVVGGAGGGERA